MLRFYPYLVLLFCLISINHAVAKHIEIPLQINELGMPLLSMQINGTERIFMLDTGSSEGLHLPEELMLSISGLRFTGTSTSSMDLTGKKRSERQFIIDSIDINAMEFKNISGVELQDWGLAISVGSDDTIKSIGSDDTTKTPEASDIPVVGLGLFRDKHVIIDYHNKILGISDTEKELAPGWFDFPYKMTKEGIVLTLANNGTTYDMVLDTGASMSIVKYESIPEKDSLTPCSEQEEWKDYPGLCWLKKMAVPTMPDSPVFNMLVLDGLPNEFAADGLLGTDFFNKFAVSLDLSRGQMQLRPHNQDTAP